MMSEGARQEDFRAKVSPHLEILLQYSMWLTKNGLDAARLVREAIAESYKLWDEEWPGSSIKLRIYKILTRRFYNSFQRPSHSPTEAHADNIDESLIRNNTLIPSAEKLSEPSSAVAPEVAGDLPYLKAIADLPAEVRPAMILAYLEGLTNQEIADIGDSEPETVESLLRRGRLFLKEELVAHLMCFDNHDQVADRESAAG
jgi:RNA polymerase sigma-70 factor (ECF subfamily)